MTTLESIQARIAKLQTQAEALATKKPTVVLEKIRSLMERHSVTIADIEAFVGKRRGRKAGTTAAAKQGAPVAKYLDPKTGATWSGHGRAPAWIANAKDRSRFLIAGATPKSAAAVKTPKAGNYVRGPQPPKYRDPKTGATWSGRGTAPGWLAGVRDRTAFLIDSVAGHVTKETGDKRTSPKKVTAKSARNIAAAKKPLAKKTAARKTVVSKVVAAKAAASEVSPVATAIQQVSDDSATQIIE